MKYIKKLSLVVFSLMLMLVGQLKTVSAESEYVYIELSETVISVEEGKTFQLKAITDPINANISWSSDATNIATVTQNGLVKGIKAGTTAATITASSGENSTTCIVVVTEPEKEKVTITVQYVLNGKVVSPQEVKSGYTSPLKVQSDKGDITDFAKVKDYMNAICIDDSETYGPYYDKACTKKAGDFDKYNKDTTLYVKVVLPDTSKNNNSNSSNSTTDKNTTSSTTDKVDKNETVNKNENTTNTQTNTNKNDTTVNNNTDKNTNKDNSITVNEGNTSNDTNTNVNVPVDETENNQADLGDAESPNVLPYVAGGVVLIGAGVGLLLMNKKKKIVKEETENNLDDKED